MSAKHTKNILNAHAIYLVRVDKKLSSSSSGQTKNSNNNNNNKETTPKTTTTKSSRDEGKKYLCISDLFVKERIAIKWIQYNWITVYRKKKYSNTYINFKEDDFKKKCPLI